MGQFSYYCKWIPKFSEKVQPLKSPKFPLDESALLCFKKIKNDIEKDFLHSIDENILFVVEADVSESALAATLSQAVLLNSPVAYFTRPLGANKQQVNYYKSKSTRVIQKVLSPPPCE